MDEEIKWFEASDGSMSEYIYQQRIGSYIAFAAHFHYPLNSLI